MNTYSAIDFLLQAQADAGGWGYFPNQKPVVEPTAAALLALHAYEATQAALSVGIAWLASTQNVDGGWGYNAEDTESNWHTAWAVLALQRMGNHLNRLLRGLAWLESVQTSELARDDFSNTAVLDEADPAVLCWSWLPGEATWIEPTALAVLAWQGADQSPTIARRFQAAVSFFEERRCPGGGWNVGNPVMFDTPLPPRSQQTALALLALRQLDRQKICPEDIHALRTDMRLDGKALALAWGNLALEGLGEDHAEDAESLDALQEEDGGWEGNVYTTAVALMAARGVL
ncbi:MAG: terpene cyclase/mutase family protein [Anaerolineales bacterium]|nr:terpene cyclase/mutase family protein [Anaerolineales bacterium]